MAQTTNREQWLTELASLLESLFDEALPDYRVTCGWPSRGGLSARSKTIGECFSNKASADGTFEIFISPILDNDRVMKIAGVLAHEMVHAAVGTEAGHGPLFRRVALKIGLCGKMTATEESEAFKTSVALLIESLGPYPHAKINASERKKQGTRMLKATCAECGYTVRLTRRWLDVGAPICPVDDIPMESV